MEQSKSQFEAIKPESGKPSSAKVSEGREKEAETTAENMPIQEDEKSVSYLGVKLEKAENQESPFVPKQETYQDYINDKFSLELQKKIAISFAEGDPILVEGGTSIGKTTTVKKMAAELGWEVHYANLNGATDVEDLMGRYIPNPHKTKPEDPEYIFADGKVTSGLRQEEGKTKVIILDELNASAPNILIRLHEVLDALERNGDVVLSEDASETVATDKTTTKIIALMNPPGRGYFGKEPLDPAQLRRWVYQKETTDLPEDTFSHSTDALFNLAAKTQGVSKEAFLSSGEQVLSSEQIAEIPGIAEILAKYKEFHTAAKEMLKQRHLAEDQPQQFSFDDRMEPRRVRDFVMRFYVGDINEIFQEALRYYYAGKLESNEDKKKLEELIWQVEYTPKTETKRKGVERKSKTESEKPARTETKLEGEVAGQIEMAEKILGEKEVIGPNDVKEIWGVSLESADIPPIPFAKEDLERAKELGQYLVLRVNQTPDGKPLTMEKMNELQEEKFKDKGGGKILDSVDWYKDEEFFTKETPQLAWALTSKEIILNSTSKNYFQQTEIIVVHIKNDIFKDVAMPKEYQDALEEFEEKKDEIKKLIGSDWEKAAEELENLKITQLTRQTPAEVLFDGISYFLKNKEKLLESKYTWTSRRSSDGKLVDVGGAASAGARVHRPTPDRSPSPLGVSFSRRV